MWDQLSGGQRQRVWVAMALAQETPLLLLDEPTTYLDIAHQIELMDLFQDLNRLQGHTIVAVLHDLNHACRYADNLIAMKSGQVVATGTPNDIVTETLIETVFGLPCIILERIIQFQAHHWSFQKADNNSKNNSKNKATMNGSSPLYLVSYSSLCHFSHSILCGLS